MKKQPVVLFRNIFKESEEIKSIQKYFTVSETRVGLCDQLVIGRYSVIPLFQEVERDLNIQGSRLINSYHQHQYIANFDYYLDIEQYTPKTWFQLSDLPKDGGPFVLKGVTNSRKDQWKTKMFAKDFPSAVSLYCDLLSDNVLDGQNVVIRQYVPLKSFGESLSGVPFADEWRLFFYKTKRIGVGYYWINSDYHIPKLEELPQKAYDLADKVAKIISENVDFFVLDLAETETGEWIVIEVNDAQMCSLGGVNAEDLYRELKLAIEEDSKE
jgi:hypothetical protein